MAWLAGGLWWQQGCARELTTRLVSASQNSDLQKFEGRSWILITKVGTEEPPAERCRYITDHAGRKLVIVGRFFPKEGNREPHIHPSELARSQGRCLLQRGWGRYVAVMIDDRNHCIFLCRDPLGLSSLYVVIYKDGVLFASDPGLLYTGLPTSPPLDWGYLATFLVHGPVTTTRTPFKGVHEVRPGGCLTITPEGCNSTTHWDPVDVAGNEMQIHPTDAAEAVHSVLTSSVRQWTYGSHGIYLDLSGGIDSSSLLVVLKELEVTVIAAFVHYRTVRVADELSFAHLVARHLDCELIELDGDSCLPFSPPLVERRLAQRPIGQLVLSRLQDLHLAARPRTNMEFMNGFGGDQVFMANLGEGLYLLDHLRRGGIVGGWTEILSASARTGWPLVNIMATSAKTLFRHFILRRYDGHRWADPVPTWCTDDLRNLLTDDILHPPFWHDLRRLSPAKARQVLEVYNSTAWVDRHIRCVDSLMLHPFLSQPLVELGLRLPVPDLYANGFDRRPLRRSMHERLPMAIVARTGKGDYFGVYQRGLRANLTEVESVLQHGELARLGLIDNDAALAALRLAAMGPTLDLWPIINLISLEIWLSRHKPQGVHRASLDGPN